ERAREVVPARAQERNAELPRRERVADAAALLAEAPLDDARRALLLLDERHDVDADLPHLARLELDLPAHAAAVGGPPLREDQLRPAEALRVDHHELVVRLVEARRDGIGQRRRVHRVAQGEVVRLDRHDVREVAAHLEPQMEGELLHALVLHDDVVLHPLADEALALDREDVLRQPARERVPEEERGGEVLHPAGREQQRARAAQRQLQVREEAHVVGEQPARLAREVADLVADAEGRAFEDAEFAVHSALTTRAPDDWAIALMTISSMLTCGGRVSANMTQSATSSAVMGSIPA